MTKPTKPRNGLGIGSKIKLRSIKSGISNAGVPYWKSCISLRTLQNGELCVFDYVWINCIGKCEFKTGDWVEISKIEKFYEKLIRASSGVNIIYKYLQCEVRKAVFEEDNKNGKRNSN